MTAATILFAGNFNMSQSFALRYLIVVENDHVLCRLQINWTKLSLGFPIVQIKL